MNITRHNYEEFFLLYVDNELSIVQRKAVEAFVEENPDLRPELVMLQQSILPADEPVMFMDKASLLRTSSAPNPVNDTNCEEYFILYADDELTNEQKDQVEQFVYRNPQHQTSFELFQQVRLMPASAVVFPDKYALYRSEEEDKAPVVRMRWWKIAAAAVVLLLVGGTTWYTMTKGDKVQPGANGEFAHTTPAIKEQTQEGIAATSPDKVTAPDQATTPAVDLTTNNQKDKKKDQPSLVVPLVKDKKTEDFATVNNKERKNIEAPRNIQEVPNVPQEEKNVPITDQDKEKTNKALASSTIGGTKKYDTEVTGLPPTRIESKPSEDMAMNNPKKFDPTDDDLYPADSDNKKNRMRGFFRKVSRVFDKATNADTDHEKSSIRIASFEFALK
jgi:anti-sigma factor RsiW